MAKMIQCWYCRKIFEQTTHSGLCPECFEKGITILKLWDFASTNAKEIYNEDNLKIEG
jgi:Zn finger protein HypA/HybF involved in hydrogenase expression